MEQPALGIQVNWDEAAEHVIVYQFSDPCRAPDDSQSPPAMKSGYDDAP